jgi:hypothetical protein
MTDAQINTEARLLRSINESIDNDDAKSAREFTSAYLEFIKAVREAEVLLR